MEQQIFQNLAIDILKKEEAGLIILQDSAPGLPAVRMNAAMTPNNVKTTAVILLAMESDPVIAAVFLAAADLYAEKLKAQKK